MIIPLKRKYRVGNDDSGKKDAPWRGGRGGMHSSSNSGKARSKGLLHPIGFSGRTTGVLIRHFAPAKAK